VDPNDDELLKLLTRTGCDLVTVVRSHGTRTVTKTRNVASGTQGDGLGQHLRRVDWLGAGAPNTAAEEELLRAVERVADAADGFVLSDYGADTITPRVAEAVMPSDGHYVGLSSRHRLLRFPGVTAAAPNLEEPPMPPRCRSGTRAASNGRARGCAKNLGQRTSS
jgi:bifunctional ADP-heptose synthase (sugar kinase/adenylyltransferase)